MVDLVRVGRTPAELARDVEPSEQCIRNLVAQADRDGGRCHDGPTSEERAEFNRLGCIPRSPAPSQPRAHIKGRDHRLGDLELTARLRP